MILPALLSALMVNLLKGNLATLNLFVVCVCALKHRAFYDILVQ